MTYQTLRYQKDGHKAIVTLNRPDLLNAINLDMEEELIDLWREIRYDHDVRAIVITGAGDRAFCAGMDIRAERRRDATETSPIRRAGPRPASLLTPKQNDCFKPTIVAVNGVCAAAGFYFVAYGDIIICSDNATFVDPHSSNGLAPVVAQVLFAYRNIPYSYLMRLGLMGSHERTDAAKALEVGLVTEVVPQAQLLERAVEIADIVSRNAPRASQALVKGVWQCLDLGLSGGVNQAWYIAEMHDQYSGEAAEGVQAFIEKREPDWDAVQHPPKPE